MQALASLFEKHRADKGWHKHYADLYQRYISPGVVGRVLELGVAQGNSLLAWLDWFPSAYVVGVDDHLINCRALEGHPRCQLLVVDQADPILLDLKPFDLIIDDAGHNPKKQQASLQMLWEKVNVGGWYVIEDIETSYQGTWEGSNIVHAAQNLWRSGIVAYLKGLADGLTNTYANKTTTGFPHLQNLSAIHWHPNIVFLEKNSC